MPNTRHRYVLRGDIFGEAKIAAAAAGQKRLEKIADAAKPSQRHTNSAVRFRHFLPCRVPPPRLENVCHFFPSSRRGMGSFATGRRVFCVIERRIIIGAGGPWRLVWGGGGCCQGRRPEVRVKRKQQHCSGLPLRAMCVSLCVSFYCLVNMLLAANVHLRQMLAI